MPTRTPTASSISQRCGDFSCVADALDYAALGETGLNFYSVRGDLTLALTYRVLAAEARALAQCMVAAGLQPGERVAVVAETQPDFVRAFCACQYAGLIPAPLPLPVAFGGRDAYVAHIRRLVIEAEAVALFATEPLLGWLRPIATEAGLRICGTVAGLLDNPVTDVDLPSVGADNVAYLQFSSGSTRFPIGVVVHQRALMANISAILKHGLHIRPDDRAVSWLPLFHDMGMVGFLLSSLAAQVSVDLLATSDFARRPHVWLSLISDNRATISYGPSFGYDLCTRRERGAAGAALDLSCWRVAGVGGDMIRPAVLAAFATTFAAAGFRPQAFLASYGMAEATLAISFAPVGQGIETDTVDLGRLEQEGVAVAPTPGRRERTVVLCGPPLPGHEIETRGSNGRAAPDRVVGRIFVRGPSLMRGYNSRPADTAAVLSADGWLDTGDLGYMLAGALVITGRAKDLIIINGRNIWPQDLEWTIERTVPQIRTGNVAAFSVEEDGHEVLILAAEARALTSGGGRDTLMGAIGDTVRAEHGLEGRVVLLPAHSLPYTSSGKLSRSIIRQRYLAGTLLPLAIPA